MAESSEIHQRLEFARKMAIVAGDSTLELFRSDRLQVDLKKDRSPVTAADRNAESLLRDAIAKSFPHDGVLGEEFGESSGTSGFRWVLDPIDGTKSFICGVPLYGTMVAVEADATPVIGVIYFPALGEVVYAGQGSGCWWNAKGGQPQRATVSVKTQLADSILLTTDHKTFAARHAAQTWTDLQAAVMYTRTWGDCYGYYLVATGRADVMIDPILNVWDAAAAMPIIQEAGGCFSDWLGRVATDSGDALASNSLLWPQLVAITRLAHRDGD